MIPAPKKRVFNFNDLMMVVALAHKHLRLILLLFCLTSSASLVFFIYSKPVFYSRSIVQVDVGAALPLDSEQVFHDGNKNQVAGLLVSPQLAERTARKLGIHASYREIDGKFIKKVAIKIVGDGNYEVEVWAYSYLLACKWCETLIEQFTEYRDEQRSKYRNSAINSFTKELNQISEKLDTTLAQKFDYQDKKNVTRTMISLNQLRDLPSDLIRVKKRISEMDRLAQRLADPGLGSVEKLSIIASQKAKMQVNLGQVVAQEPVAVKSGEAQKSESAPSIVMVPNIHDSTTSWEPLEKEQRRIQNEIREAALTYLPGHRKMVELSKELEKVNHSLDLECEVAMDRFNVELQNLKNQESDLEAMLPEYQKITMQQEKIVQDSKLYNSSQLAWNTMYSDMAKQIETLDWSKERERINLQFLATVECKNKPVSPSSTRMFLLALLGGLALAVGVPFAIEFLDHTVSTMEEVESVFHLRGLGIIPQVSSAEQERPVLLDDEGGDRNLVENFRVVRANLLSAGSLSKEPQVIMVTSSMPKEGKTVVSSNLALSFAQTGARTLLLDTDLRRGRLHRLFGLRKSPGLSGVLYGSTTLEEAVRPTGKEGLSILTSGQHVASGTEMLGTPRFAELLAELRQRYDRIIIDTPPVLGLSETSIIQSHADGVLFVVWGGRTPMANMKVAVQMLQANGANFYGFILNRLDLSATTNYYQYYYYSNDYYHNYHAIENA